jgi:hypothetical protein
MTRILPFLLLIGYSALAQNIVPPLAVPSTGRGILDTNPQPVPIKPFIGLTWKLSKSPGIETQILYRSPSMPFHWSAIQFFDATQTVCAVECTNPPIAFFAMQAVNSNGVGSKLP